jgi:hypothetical protein
MNSILATLVLLATPVTEQSGERFTHFAGYDLGNATLAEVQTRYETSRVRERGDAAEYEAWICYAVPGAEIQFNSGEMGGGTDLLGFTISATATANDCPKPKIPLPEEISGIKLGISKNQFATLTKKPVEWTGNIRTVPFAYPSKTVDGELLDVSISVIATFQLGKLSKLSVCKIEST